MHYSIDSLMVSTMKLKAKNSKSLINGKIENKPVFLFVEGSNDKKRYLRFINNTIDGRNVFYLGKKGREIKENPLFKYIIKNKKDYNLNGFGNYDFLIEKELREDFEKFLGWEGIIRIFTKYNNNQNDFRLFGFIDKDFDHSSDIHFDDLIQTRFHDFESNLIYTYIKFNNLCIENVEILADSLLYAYKQGKLNKHINEFLNLYNLSNNTFLKSRITFFTQSKFIDSYSNNDTYFEDSYNKALNDLNDFKSNNYEFFEDINNLIYYLNDRLEMTITKEDIINYINDFKNNNNKESLEDIFVNSNGHILIHRLIRNNFNNSIQKNENEIVEDILNKICFENNRSMFMFFCKINPIYDFIKRINN